MINQTLKSFNILFKLVICILLFKCYTAAPVNSSVTYDRFIEEINRDECSFPAEVSLPFSSKDTFEYLATPLKICKAPYSTVRSLEAIHLCSEIFDTLKNITCHPQNARLPKIEVVFSEDVCNDIKTLTFSNKTESLLKHLTDTFICKMMCDAEFLPACQVLLWSYEVQKQIEDAENGPQLEEENLQETEKPVVKNPEKQIVEEAKQIRVTLTNVGKSEPDNIILDNPKLTTIKEDLTLNELEADNAKIVSPSVENGKIPPVENDMNFKREKDISPVVLPKSEVLLTSIKKQNQSISNLQQDHQTVGHENKEVVVNTKQISEVEDKVKSIVSEGIQSISNKTMEENEIDVQGIPLKLNENNELSQITNDKFPSEAKEPDTSKKEKPVTNTATVNPKKDVLSPNADNSPSTTQTGEIKEKEPMKPDEGKTHFPLKDTNVQNAVETLEQKLNELNKNTETKVATAPVLSSLQTEKPIVQPVPTQPKKAEPPKDTQVTETSLGELSLTTIADLEKMEEGNEIPESSNKDQESYNDLENEGEFSKVDYVYDYDGDDGFFEPPKTKQTEQSDSAKLPDSVIESQNDLSKYPVFPGRNSIGQSADDIQVISAFPEQEDSHFFFYFLSIVLILMAGYLLFHNKQKIIALIVEGRHERRRRSHGVGYKKLDLK